MTIEEQAREYIRSRPYYNNAIADESVIDFHAAEMASFHLHMLKQMDEMVSDDVIDDAAIKECGRQRVDPRGSTYHNFTNGAKWMRSKIFGK